jgi:hypothetical protein
MTPPKPAGADEVGDERPKPSRPRTPLWRLAFDLVERPVAAASEAWVQTDVFMDALSITWKVQRRVSREVHRGFGVWLGLMDVPRRGDVTTLTKQVASLERQLRQVTRELENERRDGSGIAVQRPAATARRSAANGGGG